VVIVVASLLGPWRLLPSNAPRGALNVRMDRNCRKYRGRRHGVEGRSLARGCPGVQQPALGHDEWLLRSGKKVKEPKDLQHDFLDFPHHLR
jgi:hypothetical protein